MLYPQGTSDSNGTLGKHALQVGMINRITRSYVRPLRRSCSRCSGHSYDVCYTRFPVALSICLRCPSLSRLNSHSTVPSGRDLADTASLGLHLRSRFANKKAPTASGQGFKFIDYNRGGGNHLPIVAATCANYR